MDISVEGLRTSITDWEAVRGLPKEKLPPLSPEQREVAKKLQIPEEDYARSALAGQKTMEKLVAKTERFAGYLQQDLRKRVPRANIERVSLNTWDGKFEITVEIDGSRTPLGIAEEVVDDLFESGASDAQRRLERILDLALQARVS